MNRPLEGIEPERLEEARRERIRCLPRHHKLQGFLVRKHHVLAIDGTQTLSRDWCRAEEAQHWQRGEEVRYTAYVLEAVVVCPQGITLPISAEFCVNEPAAAANVVRAKAAGETVGKETDRRWRQVPLAVAAPCCLPPRASCLGPCAGAASARWSPPPG